MIPEASSFDDVFGYIEEGKADMVYSKLKDVNPEIIASLKRPESHNGESNEETGWNVLLMAVKYKQSDIITFLLEEKNLSVKLLGRDPNT